MTTFQAIMLTYALLVFLLKKIFHTYGTLTNQKVTFETRGTGGNFITAVLDWCVIFALVDFFWK